MPAHYSNHSRFKKQHSQPDLLIASNFYPDIELKIKRDDLFSPSYASSHFNNGRRNQRSHKKSDFYSQANPPQLKMDKLNEYTGFEDNLTDNREFIRMNGNSRISRYSSNSSFKDGGNPKNYDNFNKQPAQRPNNPYCKDIAYYQAREQELLSEINNLNYNLKQYRELNDELTKKLRQLEDQNQKRYSFQCPPSMVGKTGQGVQEIPTMEKYQEMEKENHKLKSEVKNLRNDLKAANDSSASTFNTQNNGQRIKDLEEKNRELKRKMKMLNRAFESERINSKLSHTDKYKELYRQEQEKSAMLKNEVNKLLVMNDTNNRDHVRLTEELNSLKVNQLANKNDIVNMKISLDNETKRNKLLKDNNNYLREILKIHGYDYEVPVTEISDNGHNRRDSESIEDSNTHYDDIYRNISTQQIFSSNIKDRTTNKVPKNQDLKTSVSSQLKNQNEEEYADKQPTRPRKLNIDRNCIDNDTYKPKILKSSSLSDTETDNSMMNNKQSNQFFANTIYQSYGYLEDKNENIIESQLHKPSWNNHDYNSLKKINNESIAYERNKIDEYNTQIPQLKNIFEASLVTSKDEYQSCTGTRKKSHAVPSMNFEMIGNQVDSFGSNNKASRNTAKSVHSRILQI